MRIKIKKINKKEVNTKFGVKNNYGILNETDNQWYSCFEHPLMKEWKEGMEVEADVEINGQYKNIKFPKVERGAPSSYSPANNQLIEAMKLQLDRLEKKVDRLLGATSAVMPFEEAPLPEGMPTDIPPIPTDNDYPF